MTEKGRQRSEDGCLIVLKGRGELFLAPKSFPSPPQTPPLSSKRAHKEPRKTCGREIFHQAALLYGSAGCLRRENQEGQGNGNACSVCKKGIGAAGQYRHVSAQAALSWSAKLSGQRIGDAGSGLMHGRTEAPKGMGIPSSCRIYRPGYRHAYGTEGPRRAASPLQEDVLLPCQATPQNAKRPPCGGPCILFPRPAGTGHGHRNYSALSALAGASVLASGRRVSSMMAMGALSPLRGMASFITRV